MTAFQLSPASTRAGLVALAVVVTLSVLSALAQIADTQVQDVRLAQAASTPVAETAADQVVVIVGKRTPRA